ncbi:hypothetical protein CRYUN_Cryun15aG0002900 [Craigia yunnanensis]
MAIRYWVVSLPVQNSVSTLWNRFQDQISKHSFDTPLYRFNIPNLRVGTLDSLLALSDDLFKSNSFIEGVSHKIRRQIEELERVSGLESNALTVDGVPIDSYLTRFVWDEAKYPTMSPLREIVDGIHTQVAKIEDDLKVTIHSLAVRDLSNLVKPEDIITSEHLVTLLAIVPKYSQKDWLSSYETLTSYVVPRSSKKLYEDNEYALYTVTLFGRVADNFRTSARERGFQVFSSWMHFCAVRVFGESILRYGLPPSFLACVLSPSVKGEKKVRSILEGLCDSANSTYWKTEDEGGAMAGLGGDAETHPYVSFTINIA